MRGFIGNRPVKARPQKDKRLLHKDSKPLPVKQTDEKTKCFLQDFRDEIYNGNFFIAKCLLGDTKTRELHPPDAG